MDIYNKIKRLREDRGLTQEDVALGIGFASRSAVNKIEKGLRDISITQLMAFSKFYNVSPSWLLGEDTSSETPDTFTDEERDVIHKLRKLNAIERSALVTSINAIYQQSQENSVKLSKSHAG